MSKQMYPVIHFELPTEDTDRAKRFYESVFGWQITQMGPEAGDFALAFTTQTDPESRMPAKRGAINGGFYKKTASDQQTKLTILVDDIRAVIEQVKAAGGKFVAASQGGEVEEMPGVGLFATFKDTEGNLVTLYEDRSPDPTPDQQALLDAGRS
jgi:predicted enzyme related to lactoylglutathione lyase